MLSTPAMNVVATAPSPGVRMPSLPPAGRILGDATNYSPFVTYDGSSLRRFAPPLGMLTLELRAFYGRVPVFLGRRNQKLFSVGRGNGARSARSLVWSYTNFIR